MTVRARRMGRELVVALDPVMANTLGVDEHTSFEVEVDDGAIVLRPVEFQPAHARQERVYAATAWPVDAGEEEAAFETLGAERDAAVWDDVTSPDLSEMGQDLQDHFRSIVEGPSGLPRSA